MPPKGREQVDIEQGLEDEAGLVVQEAGDPSTEGSAGFDGAEGDRL